MAVSGVVCRELISRIHTSKELVVLGRRDTSSSTLSFCGDSSSFGRQGRRSTTSSSSTSSSSPFPPSVSSSSSSPLVGEGGRRSKERERVGGRGGREGPRAAMAPAEATADGPTVRTEEAIPLEDRTSGNGAVEATDFSKAIPAGRLSLSGLTAPVTDDLRTLDENLKTVVGSRHPMLMSAAEQIFGAGGKRMRPALVFLVSRATAQLAGLHGLRPQHRRLAEITEMIHTASLIHDDVLDDSDVRRGKKTVHQLYGTRIAVLAGDFMFAQSSWYLANLDNLEVIKLISQVIADFANGEIKQAASLFDSSLTMEDYMEKSFFKTASLLAASTKCAAIFSDVSPKVTDAMYEYGRHLGLAFQVVDDILDFTQTSEQLGKPAGSDLASGNLTAPALFALMGSNGVELRELIDSEFVEDGSLERAVSLVKGGGGIDSARELARQEGRLAQECLECLPEGEMRRCLEGMVDYVLERLF